MICRNSFSFLIWLVAETLWEGHKMWKNLPLVLTRFLQPILKTWTLTELDSKSVSWNFSSACILKSGEVLTKSYKTFETNTQIHTVLTVFVLQQLEKWLHLLMDVFAHWYLIYVVWGPTWNDRRLPTKNRKILVRMWTECWKIQVSVLKNEMRP